MKLKTNLKKGEKKKIARRLRDKINIPARTICRTMKTFVIIEKLNDLE